MTLVAYGIGAAINGTATRVNGSMLTGGNDNCRSRPWFKQIFKPVLRLG